MSSTLSLYHYDSCFWCRRVSATVARLGVTIEMRNVLTERDHGAALIAATGRRRVPVLRVDHEDGTTQWMPESRVICAYLEQRFGRPTAPHG